MNNSPYIPLTVIDCLSPALLIDRNAPLDVLHANAAARVLAVTQLMETFSSREVQNADSVDLKHLAMTATRWLRPARCIGLAIAAEVGQRVLWERACSR